MARPPSSGPQLCVPSFAVINVTVSHVRSVDAMATTGPSSLIAGTSSLGGAAGEFAGFVGVHAFDAAFSDQYVTRE